MDDPISVPFLCGFGVGCQCSGVSPPFSPFSYETPQVDVSVWIIFAASIAVAGLKREPQNVE